MVDNFLVSAVKLLPLHLLLLDIVHMGTASGQPGLVVASFEEEDVIKAELVGGMTRRRDDQQWPVQCP